MAVHLHTVPAQCRFRRRALNLLTSVRCSPDVLGNYGWSGRTFYFGPVVVGTLVLKKLAAESTLTRL